MCEKEPPVTLPENQGMCFCSVCFCLLLSLPVGGNQEMCSGTWIIRGRIPFPAENDLIHVEFHMPVVKQSTHLFF